MGVMITGAASAAAFRLNRILGFEEVTFADHFDLPQSVFKETRFLRIPEGSSQAFAHQLLKICLDNHIEMVFPLRRTELRPLAEARVLFEEYGIKVIVPEGPALDQMPISPSQEDDFMILSDGLILGGQFMELTHLPGNTGIFTINNEDPSSTSLFAID